MLNIENYHKLFRQQIDVDWRVGEIFETSTAYLIQLMTIDGRKMQVNLERTPVKSKENLYELWCWNKPTTIGVASTATPSRIMLKLNDLKDINDLGGSIEFLTRDVRNQY